MSLLLLINPKQFSSGAPVIGYDPWKPPDGYKRKRRENPPLPLPATRPETQKLSALTATPTPVGFTDAEHLAIEQAFEAHHAKAKAEQLAAQLEEEEFLLMLLLSE